MPSIEFRIRLTKFYYQFGLISKYEYLGRLGDLHAEATFAPLLEAIHD